jgi:hypothetical protein
MQLISPDILAEAQGLSIGAAGFFIFVGLLLWFFGWRWHRFWIVFGISTAAGMIGLTAGKAAGGQVLVIGLLLAFAGGVMALELAKILSFLAGGVGAWLAVQTVLPGAQEMWAVFLSGGLFGVILHRLWLMLLTSLCGVLLSWHAALTLAGTLAGLNAATWAADHTAALNGAVIAVTIIGVLVQTLTAPREPADTPQAETKKDKKKTKKAESSEDDSAEEAKSSRSWLRIPGLRTA